MLRSILEASHVPQFWSVDLFREIIIAIGTSPGQINLFHQAERAQCITRTCHLVTRWYSQPLSHLHLRETYDEHVEQVAAALPAAPQVLHTCIMRRRIII